MQFGIGGTGRAIQQALADGGNHEQCEDA